MVGRIISLKCYEFLHFLLVFSYDARCCFGFLMCWFEESLRTPVTMLRLFIGRVLGVVALVFTGLDVWATEMFSGSESDSSERSLILNLRTSSWLKRPTSFVSKTRHCGHENYAKAQSTHPLPATTNCTRHRSTRQQRRHNGMSTTSTTRFGRHRRIHLTWQRWRQHFVDFSNRPQKEEKKALNTRRIQQR